MLRKLTKIFSRKWLRILTFVNLSLCISINIHATEQKLELELAKLYKHQNVQHYLVSEKYDGVRAIWKNNVLMTKNGNTISAPKWFTQDLPNYWLDGELWIARNSFERVSSIVLKDKPIEIEWRLVKYMIFDMPGISGPFETRYEHYSEFINSLNLYHVKPVIQHHVASKKMLYLLLNRLVEKGAEGLILHKKYSVFEPGRSDNVLKLKLYNDDEAKVIGYVEGKGRNKGRMGSLIVEYPLTKSKKVRFKIGTGFSDLDRMKPPELGSIITFKYYGFTNNGVPRFASYYREEQIE